MTFSTHLPALKAKPSGVDTAKVTRTSVTTSATVLISAALTDRAGVIVKNTDASTTIYLGFTAGQATTSNGYPLTSGEAIGMDIAAGVSIYAASASGTVSVAIMEG